MLFTAKVPDHVRRSVKRCSACTGKHLPVPGYGPQPCDIMSIGERPGANENDAGVPFIGKAGSEYNDLYLLRKTGLHRQDIYTTNVVKCYAAGNRTPSDDEICECALAHLPQEVTDCQPSVIILLGSTACKLIPGLRLEYQHGFPQKVNNIRLLGGWSGWIIPMYHPASGLHSTRQMIPMLEDWERFGKWLKGQWQPPKPTQQKTDYKLIKDPDELEDYLAKTDAGFIAIDTERDGQQPWSIQLSNTAGTARMILQQHLSAGCCRLLSDHLASRTAILHNAGQDIDILDALHIDIGPYVDTMQIAYHLCNQPQGLKALAYRNLGVVMRTWEDVVKPHSRDRMLQWLGKALAVAESRKAVTYKQLKTKLKVIEKPSDLERAVRRILIHSTTKPDYDPWDKWYEYKEKSDTNFTAADELEALTGDVPILSIANAPLADAVVYGCSDADMTLRVYDYLTNYGIGRFTVPQEDWDA